MKNLILVLVAAGAAYALYKRLRCEFDLEDLDRLDIDDRPVIQSPLAGHPLDDTMGTKTINMRSE